MKMNGFRIVSEVIAPASSYAGDTQKAPSMVKTGVLAGIAGGIGAGAAKAGANQALKHSAFAAKAGKTAAGAMHGGVAHKVLGAISKAPVGKIAGGAALAGVGTAAALRTRAQLNRGNQTLRQ